MPSPRNQQAQKELSLRDYISGQRIGRSATIETVDGDLADISYIMHKNMLVCPLYTSDKRLEVKVKDDNLSEAIDNISNKYREYIAAHPEEKEAALHDRKGLEAAEDSSLIRQAAQTLNATRISFPVTLPDCEVQCEWIPKSLNPDYPGNNILVGRTADGFTTHISLPEVTRGEIAQAMNKIMEQCQEHARTHRFEITLGEKEMYAACNLSFDDNVTFKYEMELKSPTPTPAEQQRLRNARSLSQGLGYIKGITDNGVPFVADVYRNGADVGLAAGPTMVVAFHNEAGLAYQSIPLENTRVRSCYDALNTVEHQLTPDVTQSQKTADILRYNINSMGAKSVSYAIENYRARPTDITLLSEQGHIVAATFMQEGARVGVPGHNVLHCTNEDGQNMSMSAVSTRMSGILKNIEDFAKSYDKYLAPTRDAVEEDLKPLTIRDNSEIDDIDTGDVGDDSL